MCVCVCGVQPEEKESLTRSTQGIIKARLSNKPGPAQSRQLEYLAGQESQGYGPPKESEEQLLLRRQEEGHKSWS